MGDATRRPPLTVEQVLDSLARSAPEFVALVRDQALSRGRLTCVLCPFDRDPNYGLGDGHRHADRDDPTTAIADELAAREGLRTLDACGEAGSRALGDGPRAMAVRRGRVLDVRKQRLGILAKVDPGSFLPRDRSAMRTGAPRRRPVAVDVLARERDVRPDDVLGDHEVPFGAWASIGDGERRRAGVRLSFSAGRAGDQFGDRK